MGFHGVSSDFGLPINQLGTVNFKCAEQKIDENNTSISKDGITVNGGGDLISDEENNRLEQLEREAAERERKEEEKRRKEEEEVNAALNENQNFKDDQIVSPKVTSEGRATQVDEGQSMLPIVIVLVAFIAFVALITFTVLYCRKKQKILRGAVRIGDDGADEQGPPQ